MSQDWADSQCHHLPTNNRAQYIIKHIDKVNPKETVIIVGNIVRWVRHFLLLEGVAERVVERGD